MAEKEEEKEAEKSESEQKHVAKSSIGFQVLCGFWRGWQQQSENHKIYVPYQLKKSNVNNL